MLRSFIDQLIEFKPTSLILLLAHAGALIAAFTLRKSMVPVMLLNAVMAAAILAYNMPAFDNAATNADWPILALIVFAFANLIISVAALYGRPMPLWAIWTGFGIDFALSALLAAFMFLFKMTRLF